MIYNDEAHIHRGMDFVHTWAEKNKPAWCLSDLAPLARRLNCCGAYNFTYGQCLIWNEGSCNKEQAIWAIRLPRTIPPLPPPGQRSLFGIPHPGEGRQREASTYEELWRRCCSLGAAARGRQPATIPDPVPRPSLSFWPDKGTTC